MELTELERLSLAKANAEAAWRGHQMTNVANLFGEKLALVHARGAELEIAKRNADFALRDYIERMSPDTRPQPTSLVYRG